MHYKFGIRVPKVKNNTTSHDISNNHGENSGRYLTLDKIIGSLQQWNNTFYHPLHTAFKIV